MKRQYSEKKMLAQNVLQKAVWCDRSIFTLSKKNCRGHKFLLPGVYAGLITKIDPTATNTTTTTIITSTTTNINTTTVPVQFNTSYPPKPDGEALSGHWAIMQGSFLFNSTSWRHSIYRTTVWRHCWPHLYTTPDLWSSTHLTIAENHLNN